MTQVLEGFLKVYKPVEWTSFDVVKKLRVLTKVKKIGHAGTLDPFAEGLLICAIGKQFTRQIQTFQDLPKTYTVSMVLGLGTNTLDPDGEIVQWSLPDRQPDLSSDCIKQVLQSFIGEQSQTPPQFSAKKINGKRAYDYARNGETAPLDAHTITIHSIDLLDYSWFDLPKIQFRVVCSKGTYIRQLVVDISEKLGYPGCTAHLIRDAIGDHHVNDALHPNDCHCSVIAPNLFRL